MKILGHITQHFNFYGWIIVAACTTAAYSAVVFYNPILGVFVNIFQEEFQWKMSEIALAITIGSEIITWPMLLGTLMIIFGLLLVISKK